MTNSINPLIKNPPLLRIFPGLLDHHQERILRQSLTRIRRANPQEIIATNRIDDSLPHLPPHTIILIQDLITGDTSRNTLETLTKTTDVDETTCEA